MCINKKYLFLAAFLLPSSGSFSLAEAKESAVAKLYSVTRNGSSKAKVTYIATRPSMDESFRAPRSKVVTDLQLINIVTKEAIDRARDQALGKAYERCYRDFSICQEVAMQVVETEASRVKTHTDEIDSGLAMEVEKTAKAQAKVKIQVRGNSQSQHSSRNEKRTSLPQELPPNIKVPVDESEAEEKSEEGNSSISGSELVSMAIEQK